MPQITKQYTVSISPEQFLDACSGTELHELQILLSNTRYQSKMHGEAVFDSSEEIPESKSYTFLAREINSK